MERYDYYIALVVGAIIAVQALTLRKFKHTIYTSDSFVPKWYHRVFGFSVGAGFFAWALYHLFLKGR